MKYNILKSSVADRIMNTFYAHDNAVNKSYCKFTGAKLEFDRNRFVQRFFKPFVGKYIAAIDTICYAMTNQLEDGDVGFRLPYIPHTEILSSPISIYDDKFDDEHYDGRPMTYHRKCYLKIRGFEAFNSFRRADGITMFAEDTFGKIHRYIVSYDMLRKFQWRIISKDEFDAVATLFSDDREPVEFNVTRQLDFDEMVSRHMCRKNCAYSKIPVKEESFVVKALGRDDAISIARKKHDYIRDVEPADEPSV